LIRLELAEPPAFQFRIREAAALGMLVIIRPMTTKICANAAPLRSGKRCSAGAVAKPAAQQGLCLHVTGLSASHLLFGRRLPLLKIVIGMDSAMEQHKQHIQTFLELVNFHHTTLKTTCAKVPETKTRNRGSHQLQAESFSNF
jgi:hypothetical protein